MFDWRDFARVLAIAAIAAGIVSCSGSAVAASPPPMPEVNVSFLHALSVDYARCVHDYRFEGAGLAKREHDVYDTNLGLYVELALEKTDPALIWRAYHRDCQPWHQPQYLGRYFDNPQERPE